MKKAIELVPYNEFWLQVFTKESETLASLLRSNLLGCEHIGSTAIPNTIARPTLDILCIVHTLEGIEFFRNEFSIKGFSLISNNENEFYFERKGPEEGRVLTSVRILKKGDDKISDILDFRDYLNAENIIAEEYKKTKLGVVQNYPGDFGIYEEAKSKFIEAVLSKIS